MPFCTGCGKELKPNEYFCTVCGLQAPAPVSVPSQQIPQKANNGLVIGLVFLAMAVGAGLFFIGSSLFQDKAAKTAVPSANQANSSAPSTYPSANLPTPPTVDRQAMANLDGFVQAKNRYDRQIRDLASAVNSRVQVSRGRLDAPDLLRQAQNCQNQLLADRGALANSIFPTNLVSYQSNLLSIYDLELTRIDGMRRGLMTGMQGGDYTPYFKGGGDAFEQFESQNELFEHSYKNLRLETGY